MDLYNLAVIFLGLLSIALYACGVIMAIGVVKLMSQGKSKGRLRAFGWPYYILKATIEGLWD